MSCFFRGSPALAALSNPESSPQISKYRFYPPPRRPVIPLILELKRDHPSIGRSKFHIADGFLITVTSQKASFGVEHSIPEALYRKSILLWLPISYHVRPFFSGEPDEIFLWI